MAWGNNFKLIAMIFAIAGLVSCLPWSQVNQLASLLQK